jgi:hypothetical protein
VTHVERHLHLVPPGLLLLEASSKALPLFVAGVVLEQRVHTAQRLFKLAQPPQPH